MVVTSLYGAVGAGVADSESDGTTQTGGAVLDSADTHFLVQVLTVPAHGSANSSKLQTHCKASKGKHKQSKEFSRATCVTIEEVKDEGDAPKTTFINPIHLFYNVVPKNATETTGKPRDKHYKCHHGNGKIITVTKAMKHNLGGLTTHLKK
ncbi:hypothetical protein B0H11DRAFT_1940017 [Mycena galericulata]|nr:hypothetical protein B0H11DRAFT_1940017 [Mycena galericulata]